MEKHDSGKTNNRKQTYYGLLDYENTHHSLYPRCYLLHGPVIFYVHFYVISYSDARRVPITPYISCICVLPLLTE